jgi:hypothetical protein
MRGAPGQPTAGPAPLRSRVRAGAGTAVVHLVRNGNPFASFERFLTSYERCDAGLDHRLVLLMKGFDAAAAEPYLERAAARDPDLVAVGDEGVDLAADLAAAHALDATRLCLLNSHSAVLCEGWLALLVEPLGDAGAVGATGSWGSHLGYNLWQLGGSGGYRGAPASRRRVRMTLHEVSGARYGGDVGHWLLCLVEAARCAPGGRRFPAPHLRTNAFVIERELLIGLGLRPPRAKRGAYRMESGRSGLSARLSTAGRAPLVADRRGRVWSAARWPQADVFWQREQADLIVADNQTSTYADATPSQRAALRAYAWGAHA